MRHSSCVGLLLLALAPFVVATIGNPLSLRAQVPPVSSQTVLTAPKFEVASIKPCKADLGPNGRSGGGNSSAGPLHIECQTAMGFIQAAYVIFANGRSMSNPVHVRILGGPSWINSERYTLDAKPENPQTVEMMNGPMLQMLLEERLRLSIHPETSQVSVYRLTIAKGGQKLKPFQDGACTPIDLFKATITRTPGVTYCRNVARTKDGMRIYDAQGTSLDAFCQLELGFLDRSVVNETGITGLFDIHLEYAAEEGDQTGATSDVAGPSLVTALQEQLGLKLERGLGPQRSVVIDHIERPSEN